MKKGSKIRKSSDLKIAVVRDVFNNAKEKLVSIGSNYVLARFVQDFTYHTGQKRKLRGNKSLRKCVNNILMSEETHEFISGEFPFIRQIIWY